MATKPSPAPPQKHSLLGFTVDMPVELSSAAAYRLAARHLVFPDRSKSFVRRGSAWDTVESSGCTSWQPSSLRQPSAIFAVGRHPPRKSLARRHPPLHGCCCCCGGGGGGFWVIRDQASRSECFDVRPSVRRQTFPVLGGHRRRTCKHINSSRRSIRRSNIHTQLRIVPEGKLSRTGALALSTCRAIAIKVAYDGSLRRSNAALKKYNLVLCATEANK